MFESYNDVITIKELCQMLKIGRNTAYNIIHSNEIRYTLVERQIRVVKADIIRFLQDKKEE